VRACFLRLVGYKISEDARLLPSFERSFFLFFVSDVRGDPREDTSRSSDENGRQVKSNVSSSVIQSKIFEQTSGQHATIRCIFHTYRSIYI